MDSYSLYFKVAEHSFQELLPNSSILLSYLCFGARFFARVKVNHRRVYSRILAKVRAVVMAMGLVKSKAYHVPKGVLS